MGNASAPSPMPTHIIEMGCRDAATIASVPHTYPRVSRHGRKQTQRTNRTNGFLLMSDLAVTHDEEHVIASVLLHQRNGLVNERFEGSANSQNG